MANSLIKGDFIMPCSFLDTTRFHQIVVGVLLLTLLCFAASAQKVVPPSDLLEIQHDLSIDYETPHTNWAQPYAAGKVKALFITSWQQGATELRENIELMQRFDLEAKAVYCLYGSERLLGDGRPDWYLEGPQAGTDRAMALLDEAIDVIFANRFELEKFPETLREKLLERVASGVGLVLLGAQTDFPMDAFRAENVANVLPGITLAGHVGQGRVVLLPPREKLTYALGWEVELDYDMARIGRALLWAAGRAPEGSLDIILPESTFQRDDLAGKDLEVQWSGNTQGGVLRVLLRRWDGETQWLGNAPLDAVTFELPLLRAGQYHIEAFAENEVGIINWATLPFTVLSEVGVTSIELAKDWAELGETISGKVQLNGALNSEHTLRLQGVDVNNRILFIQDLDAKTSSFSIALPNDLPMLVRIEAVLMEDEAKEVDSKYAFLRVTHRNQNKLNFVVWNHPTGDLGPYGMESLARHGATAILQGGEPHIGLAASNLPFVPYASSFRMSSHTTTAMLEEDGRMKYGCLHDPARMEEWLTSTVERQKAARGHGVLVYSLGDENAVRASCLSPECLVAYQQYLQGIYGTIDTLNASWETDYASFESITLLSESALPDSDAPEWFKEFFSERWTKNITDDQVRDEAHAKMGDINDEIRALQAENYPRWYDRQCFQNQVYVEWCKAFVKAFKEIDPKALTGFEGTDSFSIRRYTTRSRQGGDLDAFVRDTEYFGPYDGPANEVVRSIAPPFFPMGNWMGYKINTDVLMRNYWSQITHDMNTIQWWRWDNLDGYHGFLTPTFGVYPATRELLDDTQVVRDGLGDLLMHSRYQDDRIAMLYSQPSTYIAHFDGNPSYGLYKRDHKTWIKAIHESGLQFRYVTDRQLRLGEFEAKKFKALILPLSFAIGEQEAEVIRDYVKQGGTLIADVRPGIYNGHLKPLEQGVLDDVFGIERAGKRDARTLDRMRVDGETADTKVKMEWGNWHGIEIYPRMTIDPAVALTTGKELGKAFPIHYHHGLENPLCIVNEYGKGRAILLNFSVYNAPFQPLLASLLESAGATPKITFSQKDVEVTRWKNGDIEFLALMGDYAGEGTVTLDEKRFVYDLKAKTRLCNVKTFNTTLVPQQASFFALMPKVAPMPELSIADAAAQNVDVTISIDQFQGVHAVGIQLTQPDGSPAPWFDQVQIVQNGDQQFSLPFAQNDRPGEWNLQITEFYTGRTGTVTIAR
jgi:hypothetical protein